jgi:phosphatidylglycerol---prolipoprotein diacylglyceryl transferase
LNQSLQTRLRQEEMVTEMAEQMGQMDIAFPNLGIYLKNVPQAFYIGNFRIALYGCMIALGMLLGIIMAARIARKTGQKEDTYWDISLWLIIFSVIGARIYYVIFFWDAYKDDLAQIFNLRAGGLAIYGGVIGGILTAYVYCTIKKLYLPEILDTAVYGLLTGQIIGRWGNFFNREVFGGYSDGLLAMRLPVDAVRARDITAELSSHIAEGTNYIQVHPTFLYEGMWNLGVLIILLLFLKHRHFKGEIFLLYLAGYGIGRAWIEAIRTDQLYITGTAIPVNLVMGVVMAAVSIVAIVTIRVHQKDRAAAVPAAEQETAEAEVTEKIES